MKSCKMGRFSVYPFVRPSVHPLLWAIKSGLLPSQPGLRHQAWLDGRQAWLAGPQAWLDSPEGGTDGRTNKQTNKHTYPFYRTLSPIGAAAQKPDDRWKELFRGFKIRPSTIFYPFLLRDYSLSKIHLCMVVVGFGKFRPFCFGWLWLC